MTPEDRAKVARGANRWIDLRKQHGELVHDQVAGHMLEWLIERGYEDNDSTLTVMAHMAGNVSQEDWDRVVARAVSQLKAVGSA